MRVKSRYRYIKCVRVARRAPGVTFLSGTGYIVTDDSRPRADSPSGTVDCRWSLCKIRRRIITDERQRGAAAAPHDAPGPVPPDEDRARRRRRSPNRKGERRRRADYSETIPNSESRKPGKFKKYSPNPHAKSMAKSRYGFIHSTRKPTRAGERPESKDRTNWQSEGPAGVQRG
jgi:hypothetical protein